MLYESLKDKINALQTSKVRLYIFTQIQKLTGTVTKWEYHSDIEEYFFFVDKTPYSLTYDVLLQDLIALEIVQTIKNRTDLITKNYSITIIKFDSDRTRINIERKNANNA